MSAEDGLTLRVAAVQMDVNPAPTADRLERAERLIDIASDGGAQLVLLPELFNTGYTFRYENHARVESIDGLTATWLRDTSARLGLHLAGSLMLLDDGDAYNALLLSAPDGRTWRYDKNYPWGWERGYFRGSERDPPITVADTDLGDIGMLICWDAGHPNLWKLYAGRVDLLLISSCPVDVGHATYHLPDGNDLTLADFGPVMASSAETARLTFGEMIDQQTAWLGVPSVHAIQTGQIRTPTPMGRRSMLGYLFVAPWMLKHYRQADEIEMSCDLVNECKILDGRGQALTRLSDADGEAVTLASVRVGTGKPAPRASQPPSLVPRASYFFVDSYLPRVMRPVYRKGQRHWKGTHG